MIIIIRKVIKMDEKEIKKYDCILYCFLCQHNIADEDVRQDFRIKFYKCFDRYRKMDGIPIEGYLKKSLKLIKKGFHADYMRKNRIDMKYYSTLSIEEKKEWEVGISIDKRFYMPEDSPEVIFAKAFIKLLSFRQQELVRHLFWNCLTFKESAVRMGSTKQNISNMWRRIKDKFTNCVIIDFGSDDSNKLLDMRECG